MRNPILTLLAFAAASLLVSACQVQVTPDGPPYKLAVVGRRIIITNVSSGGNNRDFLWASSQKNEADSTYCARWVSGQGLAQNGVAFRIRSDSGGWDAAVLERNIYLREFWVSVVIYFHSGRNFGTALEVGPAVDLGAYLGRSMAAAVYPLRICAQLTGTTLRFAVAKGRRPHASTRDVWTGRHIRPQQVTDSCVWRNRHLYRPSAARHQRRRRRRLHRRHSGCAAQYPGHTVEIAQLQWVVRGGVVPLKVSNARSESPRLLN